MARSSASWCWNGRAVTSPSGESGRDSSCTSRTSGSRRFWRRNPRAEATSPAAWIHDAFQIAVQNNARRWRYVKSILERWAAEGKDDGTRPGAARKRYRR